MNPEDLKKLVNIYRRILNIEDELMQFESNHPEIKKAKEIFFDMVDELDDVRHKLRDEWGKLKEE